MSGGIGRRLLHAPLWQLTLTRLRVTLREPSSLAWTFLFPLLTSVVLGVAFRERPTPRMEVAVVDGPRADELARELDAVPGLGAERTTLDEGKLRLRRGRVALLVVPGEPPGLLVDPTHADSRMARLMVSDALQRMHGRRDVLALPESQVTAPGARYIDFLVPGLLGMGLMSSAFWGMGFNLVSMRIGKLMKRLAGTPMRRSDFLLSFALSRFIFSLVDVLFYAAFSRALFGVRITGGLVSFILFGLFASASFLSLGLLLGSRARTSEAGNGYINLASMPMMFLSGVFFSADRFPGWSQPLIRVLPLTAVNDGLRAITNEGANLLGVGPQLLVLAVWGVGSFVLALKLFRWT